MSNKTFIKNSSLIVAAIITAAFWIIGNNVNVYAHAVTGAIYELAAIPMLVLSIGIVLASAWLLYRNPYHSRTAPLIVLAIGCLTALILLL